MVAAEEEAGLEVSVISKREKRKGKSYKWK